MELDRLKKAKDQAAVAKSQVVQWIRQSRPRQEQLHSSTTKRHTRSTHHIEAWLIESLRVIQKETGLLGMTTCEKYQINIYKSKLKIFSKD